MHKQLLLQFGIFISLTLALQAQPLSLAQAVAQALENNPVVQAADQDIKVVQAKMAQVRSQQRLHISAEGRIITLEEVPSLQVPPITLPLPPQLGGPQLINLPTFPLAARTTPTLTL